MSSRIAGRNRLIYTIENADLNFCVNEVYAPAQLYLTDCPIREVDPKNEPYGGHILKINQKRVLFRVAKVTDARPGAFVTIWKRSSTTQAIVPFDEADQIDFLVIFAKNGRTQEKGQNVETGQFIFSRDLLLRKKIFSKDGLGGKLAMRVFPPWSAKVAQQSVERSIE